MGYRNMIETCTIDREGEGCRVRYEQLEIPDEEKALVMWCHPQFNDRPDTIALAAGTLLVKPPSGIALPPEAVLDYAGDPIAPTSPGHFTYRETRGNMGMDMLFHLALPPFHLPEPQSVLPFRSRGTEGVLLPIRSWVHGDRLVIIWTKSPETQYQVNFREVSLEEFTRESAGCSAAIKNLGQNVAADSILTGKRTFLSREKANLITNIKSITADGYLQQAIARLQTAPDLGPLHNDVILLSARVEQHRRDQRAGVLTHEEEATTRNRIARALLDLADALEQQWKEQ
jgi:hypothetical protein